MEGLFHEAENILNTFLEPCFKSQTFRIILVRPTREGAHCLRTGWHHGSQSCMTEYVLERQAGKGLAAKCAASHTPFPVTRDHMPPCAIKPCHSGFPLGKQRPLSDQSPLWSWRAEAICSSWLLTVKWPRRFLAQTARLVVLLDFYVWTCPSWKGHGSRY